MTKTTMKDYVMDLQLFAEPEAVETEENPATPPEQEQEPQKQGKVYTQEEIDTMIKNRLDRAMKKADEERKQAEELAKLSEKERIQKEMELKEREIEEERASIRRERLELQTSKELSARGLDSEFAPYVIRENAETTKEAIDNLQALWQKSVEAAVNSRLKSGHTPQQGTPPSKIEALKAEMEKAPTLDKRLALKNQIFELEKQQTKG